MSTEIQRRLNVLERKITVVTPCRHPVPVVYSDEEADAMTELLDACPKCSASSIGPRVIIIRLVQTTRRELLI